MRHSLCSPLLLLLSSMHPLLSRKHLLRSSLPLLHISPPNGWPRRMGTLPKLWWRGERRGMTGMRSLWLLWSGYPLHAVICPWQLRLGRFPLPALAYPTPQQPPLARASSPVLCTPHVQVQSYTSLEDLCQLFGDVTVTSSDLHLAGERLTAVA